VTSAHYTRYVTALNEIKLW